MRPQIRPVTASLIELAGIILLLLPFFLVPANFSSLIGDYVPLSRFHREFLLFGTLWSLVLLAGFHGRGLLRKLFSLRPMRFLGIISFSVYIWHMPVILAFRKIGIEGGWSGSMALALIIFISSLSYRYIELPFLQYRIRRVGEMQKAPVISGTDAA